MYRPALSVRESEELLKGLDSMTDAEVAAILAKLKAAVGERIKSEREFLDVSYCIVMCFPVLCGVVLCCTLIFSVRHPTHSNTLQPNMNMILFSRLLFSLFQAI